jgi:hypothetical protein
VNETDLRLRLEPGILNVVSLRLTLDRHNDRPEVVVVDCHTYYTGDSSIELWRAEDGRLVRSAIYNRVLSFEKVEE